MPWIAFWVGVGAVALFGYLAKNWGDGMGGEGGTLDGQRGRDRDTTGGDRPADKPDGGSGGDAAGAGGVDPGLIGGVVVVIAIAIGFFFAAKKTGSSTKASGVSAGFVAAGGFGVLALATAAGATGLVLTGIGAAAALIIAGLFFGTREAVKAAGGSQKEADVAASTVAGAAAGAVVGAAVAGPVGAVVGAVVGAAIGFLTSWW